MALLCGFPAALRADFLDRGGGHTGLLYGYVCKLSAVAEVHG